MEKLVVLKLDGKLESQAFRVTLEISTNNSRPDSEIVGTLPSDPMLISLLEEWQEKYRNLGSPTRIKPKQIRYNGSINDLYRECQEAGLTLRDRFLAWLNSEEFRPIERQLRTKLNEREPIKFLIRTEDRHLQKLPWHLWDFFKDYRQAELALSRLEFERPPTPTKTRPSSKLNILAIFGSGEDLDLEPDRQLLKKLPNTNITFLTNPQRQDIYDQLWEKSWDILFFAGHSITEGDTGRIYINATDSLTITELWYALKKAVERGLKLAIFNSCDGLGIARQLDDLQIPQIILMREMVPDEVAQVFLKHFLTVLSTGTSIYLAAREARERLESLEHKYPCASWLPAIYQNPAEIIPNLEVVQPQTSPWQQLIFTPWKVKGAALLLLALGVSGWQWVAPRLSTTFHQISFDRYQSGQLLIASQASQLALLFNPQNAQTLYNEGWRCEKLQNFTCAREKYQQSAILGNSAAYSRLARIYIRQDKNYSGAIELIQEGLRLQPPEKPIQYSLYSNLGWVRLEQGRHQEAESALQQAIQLHPTRASAYCLLAQVREHQKNHKDAMANWQICKNSANSLRPEEDEWKGIADLKLKAFQN